MGNLTKVLKFFLALAGIGLLLGLMGHGLHSDKHMLDTLGGTGEVLFFAGLAVLLVAKKA